MLLANLSLVWQVWSVMLLGAVLMLAVIVGTIEWPWIRLSARVAVTRVVATWRALFTDADLQADARHVPTITTTRRDADERDYCRRVVSPHPHAAIRSTPRDADEILIASRGRSFAFSFRSSDVPAKTIVRLQPHADDALRRRQLLALAESSPFRKTVH